MEPRDLLALFVLAFGILYLASLAPNTNPDCDSMGFCNGTASLGTSNSSACAFVACKTYECANLGKKSGELECVVPNKLSTVLRILAYGILPVVFAPIYLFRRWFSALLAKQQWAIIPPLSGALVSIAFLFILPLKRDSWSLDCNEGVSCSVLSPNYCLGVNCMAHQCIKTDNSSFRCHNKDPAIFYILLVLPLLGLGICCSLCWLWRCLRQLRVEGRREPEQVELLPVSAL